MANPLSIYSGPGQISIYDSLNDILHLGYSKDIQVTGDPQKIELLDGNIRQYSTLYKLSAQLLQSNQTLVQNINGRRDKKQEIIIVGFESLMRIKNVFVAAGLDRPFSVADAHVVNILAQTAIENDVIHYENLIAADGKFETDSNSDGIADGWSVESGVTGSIVTSFLSGEGNAQRVTGSGVVDDLGIYYDVLAPFEDELKFTFSIYAKNTETTTQSIKIFIETVDDNGTLLATYQSTVSFTAGENKRISVSQKILPASPVKIVRAGVRLPMSITFDFDNAQLELGELTSFRSA